MLTLGDRQSMESDHKFSSTLSQSLARGIIYLALIGSLLCNVQSRPALSGRSSGDLASALPSHIRDSLRTPLFTTRPLNQPTALAHDFATSSTSMIPFENRASTQPTNILGHDFAEQLDWRDDQKLRECSHRVSILFSVVVHAVRDVYVSHLRSFRCFKVIPDYRLPVSICVDRPTGCLLCMLKSIFHYICKNRVRSTFIERCVLQFLT